MLATFNDAPDDERLRAQLRACCAADAWMTRIVSGRPYPDESALARASDAATAELDDAALGQALAGHPRIGERWARDEGAWSRQEQSGIAGADAELRSQLAARNAEYERRFGHLYLVCATGRSAVELLEICRARLDNDAETERGVVREELAKINRLRLHKLLHPEEAS